MISFASLTPSTIATETATNCKRGKNNKCKTFYVSPVTSPAQRFPLDYGKTYVCPRVPNTAVCTSETEFVWLAERSEELKVYQAQPPCQHNGFSGWTLFEVGIGAAAVGALATLALKH
jgi:hypothetical protein